MSILSSLFGSKKRAKKPTTGSSGSTSPPTLTKARASSPTSRPDAPSRFLSMKRRSSATPFDAIQRRNSADIGRKKRNSVDAKKEWELPNLGFAEAQAEAGSEGQSGLGLDNVGRMPSLKEEEQGKLDNATLSVDEVAKAWNLLGRALKDTANPTSILESATPAHDDQHHALCALLLIVTQPGKLSDFPSISSHYPSSSTESPSTIWSERLTDATKSCPPQAVAAALKWALRRLQSLPSSSSSAPLISSETYIKFVQAEHAASYPADVYSVILIPHLGPRVSQLLHEIFDVWAALTAHAEDRSGLGGKLSLLLGWWIMQPNIGTDAGWQEMYASWRLAARRVEHLFLAWIRYQSTTHTLPTRLMALVDKYPFGPSEYSAETLPAPPPSSFTRRTLHLSLQTDQPLSKSPLKPADILHAALSARVAAEDSAPSWGELLASLEEPSEALVDDHSSSFLSCSGGSGKSVADRKRPSVSQHSSTFEGGRPEMLALSRVPSNAKLLDSLAEEVGRLAESHSPFALPRQASASRLRLPESSSTWDDFTKSGFGEDGEKTLDLALSPSPSLGTFSSAIKGSTTPRANGKSALATPTASPSRKATFTPAAAYSIVKEAVIDTDDMFTAFSEEGLLDPSTSANWPTYVLLRLKSPFIPHSSNDAIERLLITVEYRAPTPPPTTPTPRPILANGATPPRSSSPSGESTFRFGSFGFKRSTSRPGFRSTIFGSSRSLNKDDKGSDFLPEGDTIYKKGAGEGALASSVAVNELGKMVSKPPSSVSGTAEKKSRKAVPPLDAPGSPPLAEETPAPKETEVAAVPNPEPVTATAVVPASGPSSDTSSSDWAYGAEGGAHVVFVYTGTSPKYIGKLLRVRKISTHRDDPLEESSAVWRDQLLPRLLPSTLLVEAGAVEMDAEWLRELLGRAEGSRAEERKKAGGLIKEVGDRPRVSMMENLRMVSGGSAGKRVLAVEIKPKWGFLPSVSYLSPPKAAAIKSTIGRYTLHQHYRGKSTGEGSYDPLDLFSGNEGRISHALAGLWGIWRETGGQANSFRVFVDGNIVHPDEADTQGSLLEVTAPILIPLLRKSDALPILRKLQASLDPTDISDIVARYRSSHPDTELFDESTVPDIRPDELIAFTTKYLAEPDAGLASDSWTLRERIIAYSLSAIFKDCSIIVRAVLAPGSEEGWTIEEEGSTVKLLDLDLKPLKMRHWAELDEKIWKHWAETKGTEAKAGPLDAAASQVQARPEDEEKTSEAISTRPAWMSIPPVPTPAIGTERSVAGGFPGIPDVPAATPGLNTGSMLGDAAIAPTVPAPNLGADPHLPKPATTNQLNSVNAGEDLEEVLQTKEPEVSSNRDVPVVPNHEVEEKDVPGAGSAYSSALSTPLVPGAFNFPTVPSHPTRREPPVREVLAENERTVSPHTADPFADGDTPMQGSSTLVPSVAKQTVGLISPDMTDRSLALPSTALSAESLALERTDSLIEDVESVADSVGDARFQRSLAPSPSPALSMESLETAETYSGSSITEEVGSDGEEIGLSSPTFGPRPAVEQTSPISGASKGLPEGHEVNLADKGEDTVAGVTTPPRTPRFFGDHNATRTPISSNPSVGVPTPRSLSPSDPIRIGIPRPLPATPPARSAIQAEDEDTPHTRKPVLAPFALGMPVNVPRSPTASESPRSRTVSTTSTQTTTPARPERRRDVSGLSGSPVAPVGPSLADQAGAEKREGDVAT